jgi:hypothetical protein
LREQLGPIAQLRLERTPDKREVGSSTLPRPTRIDFGFRKSDFGCRVGQGIA